MPKVEPCPFCGNAIIEYMQEYNDYHFNGKGRMRCPLCQAAGPIVHFTLPSDGSIILQENHKKNEAIRNWSLRNEARAEPVNKVIALNTKDVTAIQLSYSKVYPKNLRFTLVPFRSQYFHHLDEYDKIDTASIELEYEAIEFVGNTILYHLSAIEIKR